MGLIQKSNHGGLITIYEELFGKDLSGSLELGEYVWVVSGQPIGLEQSDPHGEFLPDLEVVGEVVQTLLLLVIVASVNFLLWKRDN